MLVFCSVDVASEGIGSSPELGLVIADVGGGTLRFALILCWGQCPRLLDFFSSRMLERECWKHSECEEVPIS